jgi:ribosome-binding factor A
VDKLVHAVVADALERSDDDRLGLVTVTEVHVDPDLRHATVFYVARDADEEEVVEALDEARVGVQAAIGREAHLKRTPQLKFEPDPVMETGWRIEELIRQERERRSGDG